MNKHKPKALFILTLIFGCLNLLRAQEIPQWPFEGSDLPVDPQIQWGKLENGLRYVILPWNEPPERISLRLVIEAGSIHEKEDQLGLAHFIEHMAFNGTTHYSPGEMVEYFQRLGMAFGPDTNAHTWWRETVYKLELPRSDETLLKDGISLFRDYADGMLFLPEEIEKERGVVLSEKRDRDGAARNQYLDELKFALPESRISDRVTIGTEDVITNAPREAFIDYYNTWYTLDRMIVIAVGDVDSEVFVSMLEDSFGSMEAPKTRTPDPDLGKISPEELKTRFYHDAELTNTNISLFSRERIQRETETLAWRVREAALAIAERALNARFDEIAKEEGSFLINGVGYSYRWLDFVQYAGLSIDVAPESWEAGVDLAVKELKRSLEFGFTESEIEVAKAGFINELKVQAQQAATRKSKDLSSWLVRALIDGFVPVDPATEFEILAPEVASLNSERVLRYYQELWSTDDRMLYASGNFNQALENVYTASSKLEVEAPVEEIIEDFAYTKFGDSGKVMERMEIEDLGVTQIAFENGVHLNLKPTEFEDNKIRISIRVGGGKLEAPEDKLGLSMMASSLFIEGGLGEHSSEDLKKILAGKTVSAQFSVDDEAFLFNGMTTEEDLLLQLQLLGAYLTDPGYDPQVEALMKRQLDGLYTMLKTNPQAVLQNQVVKYLSGGDFRFGYPDRADLEARTISEVAAWLKEPLENGYLEINVVGDFSSTDKVIDKVSSVFGALPPRRTSPKAWPERRKLTFPENTDLTTFTFKSTTPQSFVLLQWPTVGLDTNIEEVRRFSVLADIYSDRMRIKIREAIGESYSPYAFNTSSKTYTDYGYMRAFVGAAPENASMIMKVLYEIAEELQESGIDQDELIRALEPTKNQIEEWRRNNGYWANNVLLNSSFQPYQLDWARTLGTFWDTITVEEIEALARDYLENNKAVPVMVLPE